MYNISILFNKKNLIPPYILKRFLLMPYTMPFPFNSCIERIQYLRLMISFTKKC